MLRVTNLTKSFGGRVVLDRLSLALADGDFVTVVGSNGAGKSTLFNAIAGTFLCDSGRIELDGRDVTYLPEHRRAREISRVFQDPMKGTAPSLSVAENLALAYARGTGRGLLRPAMGKRERALFRDALAALGMGLEDRMDAPIGRLSGGQRQAVTLLMCTIVAPRLLLLDEHTAALDPVSAGKVLEITAEVVARRSITAMMITHNLGSALRLGNRTVLLEGGAVALELGGEERRGMDDRALLARYREVCRGGGSDRVVLSAVGK